MNVRTRTTIIVRNDPGCKAWSVFDVRQTGSQFLAAFANKEKASLFAAFLQKQKESIQPFDDDAPLPWHSRQSLALQRVDAASAFVTPSSSAYASS
jgi:hypothetical protein